MNKMVSFVVDNLAKHYYQAELLLYSLEINSSYNKDEIIIQCLDRVDKYFLDYLEKKDYKYNIIKPYLDGRYCNKLQQLEYFKDKDIDSVILLDTDMFIVSDIYTLQSDCIMAKIVDAPNPDILTLTKIYNEANIEIPKISYSDWNMPDNETYENNFNGGFYYIPKKYITIISDEWKKWAQWLYSKKYLFDNPSKFIHVDQISFSLAIQKEKLKYKHISSNYNFPIHTSYEIKSFENKNPISIIHFHNEINEFGLLSTDLVEDEEIKHAVKLINDSIIKKNDITFYELYKKNSYIDINQSDELDEFEDKLQKLCKVKKELILHVGTPKTGTTTLQFFLDNNYENLKKNKYLYPKKYINTPAPKHQWIVPILLSNDFGNMYKYMEEIYNEAILNDCDSIILSTEGIYNHWWDYSEKSKQALKILSNYFNIKIWVFFREPVSFLESLHKQYLKNPQNNAAKCYGKNLSFTDMSKDKWFIKHLDFLGFIYNCESLFGVPNVRTFIHSKNILLDVINELGIDLDINNVKNENYGMNNITIDLLQTINKYNLNAEDKKKVVQELYSLDSIVKEYSAFDLVDKITKDYIYNLFLLQRKILETKYNLVFK